MTDEELLEEVMKRNLIHKIICSRCLEIRNCYGSKSVCRSCQNALYSDPSKINKPVHATARLCVHCGNVLEHPYGSFCSHDCKMEHRAVMFRKNVNVSDDDLKAFLPHLVPRAGFVLQGRLAGKTLNIIASELGTSRQNIEQTERRAISKIAMLKMILERKEKEAGHDLHT